MFISKTRWVEAVDRSYWVTICKSLVHRVSSVWSMSKRQEWLTSWFCIISQYVSRCSFKCRKWKIHGGKFHLCAQKNCVLHHKLHSVIVIFSVILRWNVWHLVVFSTLLIWRKRCTSNVLFGRHKIYILQTKNSINVSR